MIFINEVDKMPNLDGGSILSGYVKQALIMDSRSIEPLKEFLKRVTWAKMHAASGVEQQ